MTFVGHMQHMPLTCRVMLCEMWAALFCLHPAVIEALALAAAFFESLKMRSRA
jgi:hypothetical protein